MYKLFSLCIIGMLFQSKSCGSSSSPIFSVLCFWNSDGSSNINIIFREDSKLSKIIKLGKDVLKKGKISNVVLKLECIPCDTTYVGQRKRLLNIRREEHKNNFNLKKKKYHNEISKQRTENIEEDEEPHDFYWNNIQILHKENNLYGRLFAEMIYIRKEKENSLNKIKDTDSYTRREITGAIHMQLTKCYTHVE